MTRFSIYICFAEPAAIYVINVVQLQITLTELDFVPSACHSREGSDVHVHGDLRIGISKIERLRATTDGYMAYQRCALLSPY